MVKLPKFEQSEKQIVKEFVPRDRSIALSTGRLIVRADNYGSSLAKFDELFEVMAADALTFEPPIELGREDVEVVHYAGDKYARTFGLEVTILRVTLSQLNICECTKQNLLSNVTSSSHLAKLTQSPLLIGFSKIFLHLVTSSPIRCKHLPTCCTKNKRINLFCISCLMRSKFDPVCNRCLTI